MRHYEFANVTQYKESRSADLFPQSAQQAERLVENLAFDATVWGLPAVLQYAQLSDFAWKRPTEQGGQLNVFDHRRGLAGPDFTEFRVPNVDTLYSNGWISLESGPVELDIPVVGDRYFTANLFDAHGNASNVSNRTHGDGPKTVLLCTQEQAATEAGSGNNVMVVATPIVWVLLRVQVVGTADVAAADAIRKQFRIRPRDPRLDLARYVKVDSARVETTWTEFATALNTVIDLCGLPSREEALVARYRTIGIRPGSTASGQFDDDVIVAAAQRGFDSALEMIRASRSQLGKPLGDGWTKVEGKGRHGMNFVARAVMNNVGLGANVVEENTSFNTYKSADLEQLDGSRGIYKLVLPKAPPVTYFWSITMYYAETGRVFDNTWNRYAVGSALGASSTPSGQVEITITPDLEGISPEDSPNVLPAPRAPFFIAIRSYGPTAELLDGQWAPGPVELVESVEGVVR